MDDRCAREIMESAVREHNVMGMLKAHSDTHNSLPIRMNHDVPKVTPNAVAIPND
jgi:hypothetical protein